MFEIGQHFLEEARVESNFQVIPFVAASKAFFGFVGVVNIFGGKEEFLASNLETYLMGALVCKIATRRNELSRLARSITNLFGFWWVSLFIAPFNQAANHRNISKTEMGVCLVISSHRFILT